MPQISNEALAERARVNQLKPKLADVAKAMGQPIRYRTLPDGRKEPYIKFKPNYRGKTSKEWGVADEAMRPFVKADVERHAKQVGAPGEYGLVSRGKVALLAQSIEDQFCPKCDLRWSWCGCAKEGA